MAVRPGVSADSAMDYTRGWVVSVHIMARGVSADRDGARAGGDRLATFPARRLRIKVVFAGDDPAGIAASGSSWITSPPGAYVSDPTFTGVGTFDFVSTYQRSPGVQTGRMEFQFKHGHLGFASSSSAWTVVEGATAMCRGSGTINSQGSYGFLLAPAGDHLHGGRDGRKLRMRIWDRATWSIVYENLLAEVLAEGSLEIHQCSRGSKQHGRPSPTTPIRHRRP